MTTCLRFSCACVGAVPVLSWAIAMKPLVAIAMQILLLYYAGHGIRTVHDDEEDHGGGTGCPELWEADRRRDPRAVGTDSRPLNLNQHFVRAVDEVAKDAGNSIILLMDACLQDVGLHPKARATHATIHQPTPRSQQSTHSNNLKVLLLTCSGCRILRTFWCRGEGGKGGR